MTDLLTAALCHHAEGRAVIAVKKDKKPYRDGWNEYFTRPQTEAEVADQFSNGAYGVAMVLWPASAYCVLDFDGCHADEAWAATGIELPQTARNITQSGGKHLYFRMPAAVPELKRKVRLVRAACSCAKSCGVDLLIHGYAVVPPTPGYREDPDSPLECAVPIPPEILSLSQEKPTAESRHTGDATGRVGMGQRNTVACGLAGTMRARGMSIEAIAAALRTDNERRFDPPLSDQEIDGILKQAEKWAPGSSIDPEHLTDMGNARRLIALYGQDLRFCNQSGWLVWTGKRYEQDETGAVERLAKNAVRSIYGEAAACDDKDLREKLASHAHKSESDSRIKAMIGLAKTELEVVVKHDDLDRDLWALNVANGTLDLRTFELRAHRREDLITKIIDVDFDPKAVCPMWLLFLERVTGGNPELILFIQKCVGYSLTGSTKEQCFFILYGLGANGKSTFIIVVSALLGNYAMQTRTETLMIKRGDGIPNDVARLAGARFVSAIETEGGRRLAESLLKQLTGGDKMSARFLHREYFEFDPTFKLWLSTNHKPRISGTDNAIWRRIQLIPFTVTIPENERDKDMPLKLREEMPGILSWALRGCQSWQDIGLRPPEAVSKATRDYRQESDSIATFIDEMCSLKNDVSKTALYEAYAEWAKKSGEFTVSKREFGTRLLEKGFKDERTKNGRFWLEISLAGDTKGAGDT